jgi:hypothetical protein
MDYLTGLIARLPLECKPSAAVGCHLKTTTLFGIGYLGSVFSITDATLFSGSITAMTTRRGIAKCKLANWSGFCRNSRHPERSEPEHQHGKFKNEFFRVHISILLSNEQILTRQEAGRVGDVQFFSF